MPIRRKHEGWRSSDNPRHKWENENRIIIVSFGKVSPGELRAISTHIQNFLNQFGFPLEVEIADQSPLAGVVAQLVQRGLKGNKIDSDVLLDMLNNERQGDIKLRPAIVVRVNQSDYVMAIPEAIYGVAYEDGLVILKVAHKKAVRHELGHMFGINAHCAENIKCLMKWECPTPKFCPSCEKKLRDLWLNE